LTKIITFSNVAQIPKEYSPIPASKMVPDWYKNTQSYLNGKKVPDGTGKTTGTIKRCMPVFDAMTSGYLILLPADIYVSQKEGAPYYEWGGFDLISMHSLGQAPQYPNHNNSDIPKFINHWAIKTAPGYSVLFTQPLHREAPFTILAGIVDTDTYNAPVNFPFVLNDSKFEGLIPAGTPIAQVIPFKREAWQMQLDDNIEKTQTVNRLLSTKIWDRYKNMFWQKKEYR
jgi:hypothetical protein